MSRKKVLVVEDEEMVREVIGDILVSTFHVFEASNGIEALDMISKNLNPDLIITDYNMPLMNGREFIKTLRESKNEVPVICLTGRGTADLHLDMWMKGVYEYIEKPFEPEIFLSKAKTAVDISAHLFHESEFRRLNSHSEAQVHIEINKSLHSEVLSAARQQGLSFSSFVEEALKQAVRQQKKGA